MLDTHRSPKRHNVEQLFHVSVFQRDAAPRPIAARAVAVNEDLASKVRVLRRNAFALQCCDDLIVLSARYESFAKTSIGMRLVGIAELKRKVEFASGIFSTDVELTFGCAFVSRFDLVFHRAQAQPDSIFSYDLAR